MWEGGEGGDLGRIRGRRLSPGRRCRCSYFSPPSSFSSSESCREPQPKQAAASGSVRRPPPTAPPSHSEEKTRDGSSVLGSRAAAGRLQPESLHSGPSPPSVRPSPPPGRAAATPAPGPAQRSLGQRPCAAASPSAAPPCLRHPGRPRPAGIPAAGAGGGVWVATRKQEGSLGKREGGELGKTQE
jgi:hypothetical protein